MTNYFLHFPAGYTPNSQQEYILSELSKAKEKGVKYIVINASTGCGKSLIAKTLANSIPPPSMQYKSFVETGAIYEIEEDELNDYETAGTAVLTMTKALQDQYINLFKDCHCLKGKANYHCILTDDLPCDLGPCTFDRMEPCSDCPYYCARNEAVAGACSFYSYAMFMSLPAGCQHKKILICDEASEIEDTFVQSFTVDFNFKVMKALKLFIPPVPNGSDAKYDDYILWLKTFKSSVLESLEEAKKKYRAKKRLNKEDKLKYKALKLLDDRCQKIIDTLKGTEYIIDHTDFGLTFKPFKVDNIAQNLFDKSDLVVFMSATIIDHKNFAKQLGIKENEYYYIESPSVFDPKKAPIKLSDKICVTYNNKALVLPKLSALAKQICDLHKNEKGIIHTHSMDITKELEKYCRGSRFLFRADGSTNAMILNEHIASEKPTVLVSPSMSHGIDLKDDLGKFSIIMKAPFLPLGDERVKRLCEEDQDWYLDKMLSNFIQMCGRTIRSESDSSITYVLDGTLAKKLTQLSDRLPKYIKDRFC